MHFFCDGWKKYWSPQSSRETGQSRCCCAVAVDEEQQQSRLCSDDLASHVAAVPLLE
jgi:hypothetical protein